MWIVPPPLTLAGNILPQGKDHQGTTVIQKQKHPLYIKWKAPTGDSNTTKYKNFIKMGLERCVCITNWQHMSQTWLRYMLIKIYVTSLTHTKSCWCAVQQVFAGISSDTVNAENAHTRTRTPWLSQHWGSCWHDHVYEPNSMWVRSSVHAYSTVCLMTAGMVRGMQIASPVENCLMDGHFSKCQSFAQDLSSSDGANGQSNGSTDNCKWLVD